MKVLHTSDWHIGQFKGPVENGVNLRSLDTIKCLDYMVAAAIYEKPDLVCVSGDIFHQEQIGPVRYSDEVIAAAKIIYELSETAKFVVVMRGTPNHDGAGQFRVLEKMLESNKKVAVITSPQVISTPIADIACIPGFDKQEFRAKFPGLSADEENLVWTKNITDMVMGLRSQCSMDKPSILMAHYTVPGCNMESGQTSFFTNFEPVIPREALQASMFDGVFLGHIHRPQALEGLGNVFYAGAINSMNFNDENQERGFWIHEFEGCDLKRGTFFKTPYREFKTVKWDSEEVAAYLRDGNLFLLESGYQSELENKIVRIQYTCTSEQKKALNIPALQNDLYSIGVFYVSDIEAESTVEITNRGLLSEESDPLINLKKWLDEKCVKDADKVVELAEPIIVSGMKQSTTSEIYGVFRPVSITVKNYRNYGEETFDFSDISFCTINGANGAGKSSLFMDAIVDCLFEETREGDNKAWIRGTEDARSGSIEFIFDIGNKRFRVVRTRTKSGRPTLNLSQMDENGVEWLNLSKERIFDTQAEIERVIGMDSMTFRSCALIMQDQYGLFLQAKKDERMSILGNLLGLGVYGVMESEARKLLGDSKRELMSKKAAANIKAEIVERKGNPEEELETVCGEIAGLMELTGVAREEQEKLSQKIALYEKEKENRDKLSSEKIKLEQDELVAESKKREILKSIDDCETILKNAVFYRERAQLCREASDQAKELSQDVVLYESENKSFEEIEDQIASIQKNAGDVKKQNMQISGQILKARVIVVEETDSKLKELDEARHILEVIREKKDRHSVILQEANKGHSEAKAAVSELSSELKILENNRADYERQKRFIDDSGCPDISKASCKFLEKAKADVDKIEGIKAKIEKLKQSIQKEKEAYSEYASQKKAELECNGYDAAEEAKILDKISSLEIYQKLKKQSEESEAQISRLTAEKDANDKIIASYTENVSQLKIKAQKITERVSLLSESVKKYHEAVEREKNLKIYIQYEQQLPVYEERKANLDEKLKAAEKNLDSLRESISAKTIELGKADELLQTFDTTAPARLTELNDRIKANEQTIAELNVKRGTLLQKAEDMKALVEEIKILKKEIERAADVTDKYDILKQAFSQDGVPHQIVRNIIPYITDTANNILGQMTGGTMGVEFVMERTVKGKDGDKAALDVLINEYGKTTLPYASKSGGEKVKSSLAVILALSEVKAASAGIQLGMLFIDEPPFLDSDGTEAYVDALETIRERYPDVKIMAITHDEAMKARFSQSVTVIKSAEGSKVIY